MTLIKYGILDDEGQVVRWVYDKPAHDQFIVVKIKRQKRKAIDWANIEEAPF